MKTKTYLYVVLCIMSVSTIFLTACKKHKESDPVSFVSNVSRPVWIVPTGYDYTSSMTAVVTVDLAAQYPETATDFVLGDNDLLAAFCGETCLGVASPQEGLFFLYIVRPMSNSDSGQTSDSEAVSLRYYSAHYKNIFEANDAFTFANDTHLGTIAEPFVPTFVVVP